MYYLSTGKINLALGARVDLSRKDDYSISPRYIDWPRNAAACLRVVAGFNVPNKDVIVYAAARALSESNLAPGVGLEYLAALKELRKKDPNALSNGQYADILLKALETENTRLSKESKDEFRLLLISELTVLNCRTAVPRLYAMSLKEAEYSPKVRDACRRLYEKLHQDINQMWLETPENKASDPRTRAAEARKALSSDNSKNCEVAIQQLFNSYKGYSIRRDDEQGINVVTIALRSGNERLRLAAAMVALKSDSPKLKGVALGELSQLVVGNSATAAQAMHLLSLQRFDGKPTFILPKTGGLTRIVELERNNGNLSVKVYQSVGPLKTPGLSAVYNSNGETEYYRVIRDENGNAIRSEPVPTVTAVQRR